MTIVATTQQKQFFATKKREIYFETVELYHRDAGLFRFVARQVNDRDFTLESTAPRNPSETVTFKAAGMSISQPELSSGVLSRTITFQRIGSGIDSILSDLNDNAAGGSYLNQIEVIYRVYIGTNTSAPANNIEALYGVLSLGRETATIQATDEQAVSVYVAELETEEKFPSLRGFK